MALLREALMTGEEFLRRPDLEFCELVDGRIVPVSVPRFRHGVLEALLGAELLVWARGGGHGRVMTGDVGMYIRRNPDTVRGADVAFISTERAARNDPRGYMEVAPELVVEVLSPDDRWKEVQVKVADYFSAGVSAVWVVDPRKRRVLAYRSPAVVETFAEGQTLTDPELLPGFSLPL